MTEYHEHSRILQANFRNMTLRDKGRGDRRGTESVAEEKFSIVFQVSRFCVDKDHQLQFYLI